MRVKIGGHISRRFNQDLEKLRTATLEMGGLVERQIHNAICSLDQSNSQLATEVEAFDDRVNQFERKIEEQCTHIIVKRQPAANDLRMVLSVARIVRDLERMGDEAVKIAKLGLISSELGGSPTGHAETREIATLVSNMLSYSLDAFARYDATRAKDVIMLDEEVDAKYANVLTKLTDFMSKDASSVKKIINLIWALRSLERVGDHAKNICGQVVYIVDGRHID